MERDDEREKLWKRFKVCGVVIGLLGFALAILLMRHEPSAGGLFVVLVVTTAGMLGAHQFIFRHVSKFTKEQIVGGICNYVGWKFESKPNPSQAPSLERWGILNLLPAGYDALAGSARKKTARIEDLITGQAHGADFSSIEIELVDSSGENSKIDFHGQIITIGFPRKFLGRTIVLRDKGRFQSKKRGDMKRVGLVDPVFEKIFEAYGTDQVEARYLLTPTFMEKLIDLENSVDGRKIRFGFDKSELLIAIETGNRFEAGSMRESLTDPARTQKLLDEIGAIYDIVDGVMDR